MYSPFTKNHVYTDHSPHQLFGTVSQSYLKCCFLGCSFHSAPNKTELAILTSCLFFFLSPHNHSYKLPMLLVVKNKTKQNKKKPTYQCRRQTEVWDLIREDPLGGGHGNSVQYSCPENPIDRRAWWAIVHRIAKSWIWLKQLSTTQVFSSLAGSCWISLDPLCRFWRE